MIHNIRMYFIKREYVWKTNQQYIRIKQLFRGFIIKNWLGMNFNTIKYYNMNKVVVSMCVLHYNKCQKYNNEAMNDKEYQIQRIKIQYKNERINAINGIHYDTL